MTMNHQKKIARLIEEKEIWEADCSNFLRAMWNDESKPDFRCDAKAAIAVAKKVEKTYAELMNCAIQQDKSEYGDDAFSLICGAECVFEQIARAWENHFSQ